MRTILHTHAHDHTYRNDRAVNGFRVSGFDVKCTYYMIIIIIICIEFRLLKTVCPLVAAIMQLAACWLFTISVVCCWWKSNHINPGAWHRNYVEKVVRIIYYLVPRLRAAVSLFNKLVNVECIALTFATALKSYTAAYWSPISWILERNSTRILFDPHPKNETFLFTF